MRYIRFAEYADRHWLFSGKSTVWLDYLLNKRISFTYTNLDKYITCLIDSYLIIKLAEIDKGSESLTNEPGVVKYYVIDHALADY